MMAAFPFQFPPPDSRPVGYGFRPTEEELISHYLHNKMLGNEYLVQSIPVVDLYNHEPQQLPALSTFKSDNHEWFFFHPESSTRLHRNSYKTKTKINRTTSTGYWKSTGVDRKIKARGTNDVIGTRKILVFHQGKTPHGVRTRWILHEYRLQIQHHPDPNPYKTSFIVCRLKENAQHVSNCDQHDSSHLKRKATEREIQEVYSDTQPDGPSVLEAGSYSCYYKPQSSNANGYDGEIDRQIMQPEDSLTNVFWDERLKDVTSKACVRIPTIKQTFSEPYSDLSFSEPQLASINFQSANAYANGEIPMQPEAIDNDDDFIWTRNKIESFVQDPLTHMLELSFSSDDLTRWLNELESLLQGPVLLEAQGPSSSPKTFKAPKSKVLKSSARRILLFIVRAISQYKAKEDEKRKRVVGPTSQISITDSSNGQKSEGGNKYGYIDSTTKHIQQEQHITNVPSVDVVKAFLAIIMLVLSVRILLQLLWERVLKMMQGRRGRYLFVALLSCAAVWWNSG